MKKSLITSLLVILLFLYEVGPSLSLLTPEQKAECVEWFILKGKSASAVQKEFMKEYPKLWRQKPGRITIAMWYKKFKSGLGQDDRRSPRKVIKV
jgi:Helix-turn-helix domain (DUF4817)